MPEYFNLTPTTTAPSPKKALTIYHNAKHHVYTFASSNSEPAEYTIVINEASNLSLFHRGSGPASAPGIPVIGSMRAAMFWAKLNLELGDGVEQVEHNRNAVHVRAVEKRKNRWRRAFRMQEKPETTMESVEISGLVLDVCMERKPRLGRAMKWEFDGVEYVWTGTRRMARSWLKGVKGYSHDMKLTRTHDHALLATYEKKHFARSEDPGKWWKAKKRSIGTFRIFPDAYNPPQNDFQGIVMAPDSEITQNVRLAPKHRIGSNLTGTHTGDLFEEAVVLTCWSALKAEHKIRHTILDIIILIAENAGG